MPIELLKAFALGVLFTNLVLWILCAAFDTDDPVLLEKIEKSSCVLVVGGLLLMATAALLKHFGG